VAVDGLGFRYLAASNGGALRVSPPWGARDGDGLPLLMALALCRDPDAAGRAIGDRDARIRPVRRSGGGFAGDHARRRDLSLQAREQFCARWFRAGEEISHGLNRGLRATLGGVKNPLRKTGDLSLIK